MSSALCAMPPNSLAWAWAWPWRQRPHGSRERSVLRQEELAQLSVLGIHPEGLAGRLRLVLSIGCYHDFRFTRDILSTGAASQQAEMAIQALVELGAHCDCEVLQALGQLPRGVLWHHRVTSDE